MTNGLKNVRCRSHINCVPFPRSAGNSVCKSIKQTNCCKLCPSSGQKWPASASGPLQSCRKEGGWKGEGRKGKSKKVNGDGQIEHQNSLYVYKCVQGPIRNADRFASDSRWRWCVLEELRASIRVRLWMTNSVVRWLRSLIRRCLRIVCINCMHTYALRNVTQSRSADWVPKTVRTCSLVHWSADGAQVRTLPRHYSFLPSCVLKPAVHTWPVNCTRLGMQIANITAKKRLPLLWWLRRKGRGELRGLLKVDNARVTISLPSLFQFQFPSQTVCLPVLKQSLATVVEFMHCQFDN